MKIYIPEADWYEVHIKNKHKTEVVMKVVLSSINKKGTMLTKTAKAM